MNTLKTLARLKDYEIRSVKQPLKENESFDKVITPLFSSKNGGTIDSVVYYNNFYLYPSK